MEVRNFGIVTKIVKFALKSPLLKPEEKQKLEKILLVRWIFIYYIGLQGKIGYE